MMTVELLPADEHNQRTINQSHPPGWWYLGAGRWVAN
jgi:hypothetical protein